MTSRLPALSAPLALLAALLIPACAPAQRPAGTAARPASEAPDSLYMEWPVYRGDAKANQFSSLAQIHAANVHTLQPIWEYHTGDANASSSMQVNPIMIDGLLYFSTPTLRARA